jgi:hypothetical protein
MTKLDQLLTTIAITHLNIRTLKSRRRDSLDFHDVAVWGVKAALTAAFEAGANAAGPPSEQNRDLPTRFDDYEIQPCRRFEEPDSPGRFYFESCNADDADVWTLYGHIPGQGGEAIGDFGTYQHAEEVFARITGRRYADNNTSKTR